MAITFEIDKWLRDTYENHCFISWPHTENPDITQCAQAVKTAIREGLAASFHGPKVFLDESVLATAHRELATYNCDRRIITPIGMTPFKEITASLRQLHLEDEWPWLVGASGGPALRSGERRSDGDS